jgi:3-phenylpropionate/cinnamic acid dioxygenase small subunit
MAIEAEAALRRLLLQQEIETFFLAEADLLDARRFDDWLALFAEDVRYFMPLAQNRPSTELALEYSAEGSDACWFDEGIETLRQRVVQLSTGVHWAEQPPSRTTHMISNLALTAVRPESGEAEEIDARCRFLVYRNRLETEEYFYIGKRNDRLRRIDGRWRIARREILLDQNVLLAKNLSVFF